MKNISFSLESDAGFKYPRDMDLSPGRKFRCVLHGSFRRHFGEIQRIHRLFTDAGIEVLAPAISEIKEFQGGFAVLGSDTERDQRMIELLYLHHLARLGPDGFSYFINPEGYIGKSASYELGIAQVTNVRCFFAEHPADHPAYLHKNSVWKPERLAEFILEKGRLPAPRVRRSERALHRLWTRLMVPGSIVAAGGIIEYADNPRKEKEILLVRTHKWGGRFSVVGGRVRRGERIQECLRREVSEETGLRAEIGEHVCTFDQIRGSGYYLPGIQHIFVDKVIRVGSKKVSLNDEAESFVWTTPGEALRDLPLEPNARHVVALYAAMNPRK